MRAKLRTAAPSLVLLLVRIPGNDLRVPSSLVGRAGDVCGHQRGEPQGMAAALFPPLRLCGICHLVQGEVRAGRE